MNDTHKLLTMEEMQQEHQALDDKVTSLKNWWKEVSELGIPHYYEMGVKLKNLRAHLAVHIQHELERSFLSPEMAANVSDQTLLEEIKAEHETLLQQLDEIIAGLQQTEPEYDSWSEPRQKLEAFLAALHEHEQRENIIMQEAYANSAE